MSIELVKTTDRRILRLSPEQNREEVNLSINSNRIVHEVKTKRTNGQIEFLKNAKKSYSKWKKRNPDHKEQIIARFAVN